MLRIFVIPDLIGNLVDSWIPAFAGMTVRKVSYNISLSSFLFLYYNIVGLVEGPPELTIRLFRTIRSRLMERSKAA